MMPRSPAAEFAYLERLPPEGALAYLKRRQKLAVTYSWQDLWEQEHTSKFTVSRLTRLDLLAAVRDGITASVNGDLTRRDWTRDTNALLKKAGWWGEIEVADPVTGETVTTKFDSARLRLIFDTNTRMSYAAGQWQRIEQSKTSHPYVRYITKRDERVREEHRSWDNLVLPVDDPFWKTHAPPNGYRCRCRISPMSRREYERRAAAGEIKTARPSEQTREYINKRTGEVTRVPEGIDPGFAYNPGMSADARANRDALIGSKLANAGPELASAAQTTRLTPELPDFDGQRPGLYDLPPILLTEIGSSSLSHAELIEQAKILFNQLREENLFNDDSGWLLGLNRKSYKKIADNTDQTSQELQAVGALEQLVRRAVVAEKHPDTRHQNEYVQSVFRLYAPLRIGDAIYRVKLTVKNLAQGNDRRKILHALDAVEIESAPLGTLPNSGKSAVGTGQPTTGRTITIDDLLRGAQRDDGTPFRK
ncbi:MAG: minor capsid protein [Azoarcus sp.]|nr:minor capsid protein [Azoarcus sp.]